MFWFVVIEGSAHGLLIPTCLGQTARWEEHVEVSAHIMAARGRDFGPGVPFKGPPC